MWSGRFGYQELARLLNRLKGEPYQQRIQYHCSAAPVALGPVVGPEHHHGARAAVAAAIIKGGEVRRGAAVALGNTSLGSVRPGCSAAERRPASSATSYLFFGQPLRTRARAHPPPLPARLAPQSTSRGSGRRPSSRRARARPTGAPVAPIAVTPRRHRAFYNRHWSVAAPPRPPASRRPPAAHLALHRPSNLRPPCRMKSSGFCGFCAGHALARSLSRQMSTSASRSIAFWARRDSAACGSAACSAARSRWVGCTVR